jgi:isopentenyl diphosphate isomerase/L-lactate dehydrogenase-like FMN-dependent dehydrogenase
MSQTTQARRRFLRFLGASPLLATVAPAVARDLEQEPEPIGAPDRALNVMDFEAVAQKELPPAHFGYVQTGVDDDATVRANRAGFGRFALRVRRLVDVREIDMSVSLLGVKWDSPIVLSPVGSQRCFHPEGELAVARAARAKSHLQILSTVASTPVEEVIAARGAPIWFQLYPTDVWPVARGLVKRAEAAGCSAIVLTTDLQGGSNRETLARAERRDTRECVVCHQGALFGSSRTAARAYVSRKPNFKGLDVSGVTSLNPFEMNWDDIKKLRDASSLKLLIKGIVTREDAQLAIEHGIDGIIVSNHGGRGEESGRATIESLVEVVDGTQGRLPVIVDGGFRRGTDIFKALALGATAVGIGRPYIWGLAGFGQPGVEAVLEILRKELRTIMRQAGTRRVADITRAFVADRGRP